MADAKMTTQATSVLENVAPGGSLLDTIVENGRLGQTEVERNRGKGWLKELADQVLKGEITVNKDTDVMLAERIKQLDELISLQLNEVMHAPEVQKLEGSWRGLHYFVQNTETSTMLKIKVMDVSKKDLLKDLQKAVEFDQSTTFKKVYEE